MIDIAYMSTLHATQMCSSPCHRIDSMLILWTLQVVDIYAAMRRDERLKWYM